MVQQFKWSTHTNSQRQTVTDKVIPTYLNSPTQTLLPWQVGRGLIKFHIWERITGTQALSYKLKLISGQQTQVHMYYLKLTKWIHHYIMASLSFISPAPLYFLFLQLKPHNSQYPRINTWLCTWTFIPWWQTWKIPPPPFFCFHKYKNTLISSYG